MSKRDVIQFIIAILTMIAIGLGLNQSTTFDFGVFFSIVVMAINIVNGIYWVGRKDKD